MTNGQIITLTLEPQKGSKVFQRRQGGPDQLSGPFIIRSIDGNSELHTKLKDKSVNLSYKLPIFEISCGDSGQATHNLGLIPWGLENVYDGLLCLMGDHDHMGKWVTLTMDLEKRSGCTVAEKLEAGALKWSTSKYKDRHGPEVISAFSSNITVHKTIPEGFHAAKPTEHSTSGGARSVVSSRGFFQVAGIKSLELSGVQVTQHSAITLQCTLRVIKSGQNTTLEAFRNRSV